MRSNRGTYAALPKRMGSYIQTWALSPQSKVQESNTPWSKDWNGPVVIPLTIIVEERKGKNICNITSAVSSFYLILQSQFRICNC